MNKILAFILALTMVFSMMLIFTGCEDKNNDSSISNEKENGESGNEESETENEEASKTDSIVGKWITEEDEIDSYPAIVNGGYGIEEFIVTYTLELKENGVMIYTRDPSQATIRFKDEMRTYIQEDLGMTLEEFEESSGMDFDIYCEGFIGTDTKETVSEYKIEDGEFFMKENGQWDNGDPYSFDGEILEIDGMFFTRIEN